MLEDFVEKVKGFLMAPVETFQEYKDEDVGSALAYYVVLLLIYAVLSTIVGLIGFSAMAGMPGMGAAMGAAVLVIAIIGGIIGLVIGGIILHLGVIVGGGKAGLMQTFKAVIYASTPMYLLGWIPFIGIIFSLWSLVLTILGIRELQELTTGKAVLAFIVALIIGVIIMFVIGLALAAVLIGAMAASGMM